MNASRFAIVRAYVAGRFRMDTGWYGAESLRAIMPYWLMRQENCSHLSAVRKLSATLRYYRYRAIPAVLTNRPEARLRSTRIIHRLLALPFYRRAERAGRESVTPMDLDVY
jgi:hypothetical protein